MVVSGLSTAQTTTLKFQQLVLADVSSGVADTHSQPTTSHYKSQEQFVLHDMSSVLLGFEGDVIAIQREDDIISLSLPVSYPVVLHQAVKTFEPLISSYIYLEKYVSNYSNFQYGQVHHALCLAISKCLAVYRELLVEYDCHSISQLYLLLQPSLTLFCSIQAMIYQALSLKLNGGAIISLLHKESTRNGHLTHREIFRCHIESCYVPYFNMLSKWLTEGHIADPYKEFMIEEKTRRRPSTGKAAAALALLDHEMYWEQRYVLVTKNVLPFLQDLSQQILLTGKYVNVIKECGKSSTHSPQCPSMVHCNMLRDNIVQVYRSTSIQLLQVLIKNYHLMDILNTTKAFFTFEPSVLFGRLWEGLLPLCQSPKQQLDVRNIQSEFQSVFQDYAQYDIQFNCFLSQDTLTGHLLKIMSIADKKMSSGLVSSGLSHESRRTVTGHDLLTIDVVLPFPVSVLIGKKIILKYQLLFRQLYQLKYAEHCLKDALFLAQSHRHAASDYQKEMQGAIELSRHLLHVLFHLQYHLKHTVLDTLWQDFLLQAHQITILEDLLTAHGHFVDTALRQCLMTERSLVSSLDLFLQNCHSLVSFLNQLFSLITPTFSSRDVSLAKTHLYLQQHATSMEMSPSSSIHDKHSFHRHFESLRQSTFISLKSFLDACSYVGTSEPHLIVLLRRIDLHGFYAYHLKRYQDTSLSRFSSH